MHQSILREQSQYRYSTADPNCDIIIKCMLLLTFPVSKRWLPTIGIGGRPLMPCFFRIWYGAQQSLYRREVLHELNKNPSKYICDFALHHTYENIWRACMAMAPCTRCLQGHLIPNDALLQHSLTHHTLITVYETFTAAILNLASYT